MRHDHEEPQETRMPGFDPGCRDCMGNSYTVTAICEGPWTVYPCSAHRPAEEDDK